MRIDWKTMTALVRMILAFRHLICTIKDSRSISPNQTSDLPLELAALFPPPQQQQRLAAAVRRVADQPLAQKKP